MSLIGPAIFALYVTGFVALIATALVARSKIATFWASCSLVIGAAAVTLPQRWFPNPTSMNYAPIVRANYVFALLIVLLFGVTAIGCFLIAVRSPRDEVRLARLMVIETGIYVGMLGSAATVWVGLWQSELMMAVFGVSLVAAYVVLARRLVPSGSSWSYAAPPVGVAALYAIVGFAMLGGPA